MGHISIILNIIWSFVVNCNHTQPMHRIDARELRFTRAHSRGTLNFCSRRKCLPTLKVAGEPPTCPGRSHSCFHNLQAPNPQINYTHLTKSNFLLTARHRILIYFSKNYTSIRYPKWMIDISFSDPSSPGWSAETKTLRSETTTPRPRQQHFHPLEM